MTEYDGVSGLGVPLVTPFDETGAVDRETLRELTDWLESAGADFLVPCGSSGEAPLLEPAERTRVVETVVDATDLPVLAGTGHEGFEPTLRETERAAEAGADAALVVTPSYYGSDDAALAAYFRDLADESPLPIYLYSVPKFTDHALSPRTVESLATHENVRGIKDSRGHLQALARTIRLTRDEAFDVLAGSAGVYAAGLAAGADGGVLAVSNVAPELAAEAFRRHRDGDADGARELNESFLEIDHAVTTRYGVPGIKAALSLRGHPVGDPRRPLRPVDPAVERELETLLDDVPGVLE